DEAERRMIGHQMAAALAAILPLAELGLLEHADMLGAGGDAHGFRLPQAEGVDGAARPRAARGAVTIAHRFGRAGRLDLDRAAEAFARRFHPRSPFLQGATPALRNGPVLDCCDQAAG